MVDLSIQLSESLLILKVEERKGKGCQDGLDSGWDICLKYPSETKQIKKTPIRPSRLPLVSIFFIQNYVKSISPALNCIRKGPALQIAPVLGLGSTPYLKKVREENPCHQVFKEFSSFFF